MAEVRTIIRYLFYCICREQDVDPVALTFDILIVGYIFQHVTSTSVRGEI